ncbi:MAG: recombination regulator RecX [Streptococcaceae bacterium]|nr:recombination regulator RecX [Streptococcaceae bacterium]
MVKITEIKKLKRLYKMSLDQSITLDIFDEEKDKLYICEDTIVKYFLTKDKEMSLQELEQLVNYDQFAQGKSLALYHLSFKARTAKEVRTYLSENNINANQINQVIEHLEEIGVLNDYSYAENFIQGKVATASSGPYQIRQKLGIKGISTDIIDRAVNQIYTEEKQIEVACKLAEKYARQKEDKYILKQLKQKITEHLIAKGFTYSIAEIVIDDLDLEPDDQHENDLLYRELDKVAPRYARRYDGYERNQKITMALARKGFDFDDIRSAIDDYDFED